MASGHVNRTQRPNTWLHRPTLRREDSPCQLGAVHTWPEAAVTAAQRSGCNRSKSGHCAVLSFGRDWPIATFCDRQLPHCERFSSRNGNCGISAGL